MATTGPSLKRTSIMQCKESVARILLLDAQSQLFACNWTTAASSYPLTGSEKLFGGCCQVGIRVTHHALGNTIDDTTWGPERAQRIAALRVEMGLPETASAAERSGWR